MTARSTRALVSVKRDVEAALLLIANGDFEPALALIRFAREELDELLARWEETVRDDGSRASKTR